MTPQISAYMTSIRPYRWMRLHEILSKTNLSFEIVIVGPIEADFELPSEIKFHKSALKPSQCQHAAASMCIGDCLLQIVDDLDYQDGAIEAMYNKVSTTDNVMATCHYHQNGIDHTFYQNTAGQILPHIPLLPVCGLFPRQAFIDSGGIDKRFIGVMGELDLYMRISQLGYKTVFVDFVCNENTDFQNKEKSSLCSKFWPIDRPVMIDLWSTNNQIYLIRNDIVRKYSPENLLTVEQNV
jgi:hypothetical protein